MITLQVTVDVKDDRRVVLTLPPRGSHRADGIGRDPARPPSSGPVLDKSHWRKHCEIKPQ